MLVPQLAIYMAVAAAVLLVARALVLAVLERHLGDLEPAPPLLQRAQGEVPVLVASDRGVEAAGVLPAAAPDQPELGPGDRAVQQDVRVEVGEAEHPGPGADQLHQPVAVADVRVALEGRAERVDCVEGEAIVGVHHQQQLRVRVLEARVSRGRDARVLLADQLDALGQLLKRSLGLLVGRAVVDDDHLRRPAVLAQGTLDRLEQEAPVVEAGDHHSDVAVAGHGRGAG